MNENIKKLIEQTDIYCDQHWLGNPFYEVKWEEKFAELLIKDCANRVNGMVVMDKGHIPQDPHSQGWNRAVAYAGKELKKHFGVEE
jgi:hypothetical protein